MRLVSLLIALSLVAGVSLGTVSCGPAGSEAGLATLDVCSKHLSAQTGEVPLVCEVFCLSYEPALSKTLATPDDTPTTGPETAALFRPPVA